MRALMSARESGSPDPPDDAEDARNVLKQARAEVFPRGLFLAEPFHAHHDF